MSSSKLPSSTQGSMSNQNRPTAHFHPNDVWGDNFLSSPFKMIDEALHNIYEHDYKDDQTLEATSLRFRLLRDNGFNGQCDMFSKFKDNEGNFKKSLTSDMEDLLELYEAAHLCVHGEDILEEALAFITTHLGLEKAAGAIEYPLSASVSHALYRPIRKSLPRLEARRFISIYGENASHDKMLLKFAELDFCLLQISHKEELSKPSRKYITPSTFNINCLS
ncbi:(+)-delta-cadinene synthase isozyme XC14-like [Gossypium australe]|uniref:(+)-delta-cadinene synthase isozyme XC14-like n=1 Tax=Gossypium australe TaxID=47621 RepID=A0A5B6VTK8_9ROSI|nr:(+)-delta-cadinene synthase isozyme XC14-like [Gossypium australe]